MSSHTPSSRAQSPNSDGFITPIRLSDTDTTPSPSKWSSPPVSPGLLTSKLALLEAANALSAAAETLAVASQAMSSAAKSLATASSSLAHGSVQDNHTQYKPIYKEYSPPEHSRSPSPVEFEWQAPSYSLRTAEIPQDNGSDAIANTIPTHTNTSTDVDTSTQATSFAPSEPMQTPAAEGTESSISVSHLDTHTTSEASNEIEPIEDGSLDAFAQLSENDHGWGSPIVKPTRPSGPPLGASGSGTSVPVAKFSMQPPAPVVKPAAPVKPPVVPQVPVAPPAPAVQPATSAKKQSKSDASSNPSTALRDYILLKSEFDIIPLICYLANQAASDNVLCFVKSVATIEPLAKMIDSLVPQSVCVDLGKALSQESAKALDSPGAWLLIRSAYTELPAEVLKKPVGLVIHIGWTGDETMYRRQTAGATAKPNRVVLTETESPKGSKTFNELQIAGIQSTSNTETSMINNQTSFALLASARTQWKAKLRTAQGQENSRTCYMAWIVDHNSGRRKVKTWSAVDVVTHANRFAELVLLRAKTGDVVGDVPSVTAGFVKHMKLDGAVEAGILTVKG